MEKATSVFILDEKNYMSFASLCVLAYKRPEWLRECLDSIHATIDYPCEIIVNCDGGDMEARTVALEYLQNNKISKLTLSNGKNRGVGRSLHNCFSIAEGEYIFKIDTDLIFKKNWLSTSVNAIKQGYIVSLFNYRNYDPNDTRFQILEEKTNVYTVNDFVSSIYGFNADALKVFPFGGDDDGYHQRLSHYGTLAITKQDYVHNRGFGVVNSTYVSGTMDHPYKTPTFTDPLLFQSS